MRIHRSDTEREAITRAILESPIEMSHQAIATQVGLQRETVRKIRYGMINTDVLPGYPRLEPGALARSCTDCIHFTRHAVRRRIEGERVGLCDMGFAESENLTYARGCAAFWPLPEQEKSGRVEEPCVPNSTTDATPEVTLVRRTQRARTHRRPNASCW